MRRIALVVTILALPSLALLMFSRISPPRAELPILRLKTPASEGSGQPNLFTSDAGDAYLTWTEPEPAGGHRLRFSKWVRPGWSEPVTIATGERWFVNWADFPSLTTFGEGSMAAHFLTLSGPLRYNYDIQIAQSHDGGSTWSAPIRPHRDNVQAEHGFVSLFPWNGRLGVVWLDGREAGTEHGSGSMTLRFATLDETGEIANEAVLDDRVCDCCQTSAAQTAEGLIVAFRDRSAEEVRDIAVVRLVDSEWTPPQTAHQDGWEIPGCPVNGPAIVAHGREVALAWYTQEEGIGRVNLAFSSNAGRSFDPPIQVDDGETMGRVDLVMLEDRSVVVSWLEFVGESGVEIRLRRFHPDGRSSSAVRVAETDSSRSSGFPRLASLGDDLLIAWTETGENSKLAAAKVRLEAALPLL